MCGIAGYISFENDIKFSEQIAEKLFAGIKHRGLDEQGSYTDARIILQHTRLSIIDLKTGNQPMHNSFNSHVIVFNGEIFNYEEIRTELIKLGHTFHSNSDTEVLLKSFIEWGASSLNRFNGFWAFCIYNIQSGDYFISRDRFGIKPLYYKKTEDELIFGSEIASIQNISHSSTDKKELFDEILYGSKPGGHTIFKNIIELEPGCFLSGNVRTKYLSCKRYYDIFDHFTEPKKALNIEEIEHLLKDSIKLRLRSDVPLGTLNSGGLDSSLISSIVINDFKIELNTFSVAPELAFNGMKKDGDESYWAELLANHIGAKHKTIRYSEDQYFELLDKVNEFDDSFMSHPNTVALYFMLKYIKEKTKIKVLLGGDGADEIFRGYSNNTYASFLTKTSKIPLLNKIAANYFKKKFTNSIVSNIQDKYSLINCLSIAHSCQRINGNKITQILGLTGNMSEDRLNLIQKAQSLSEYDQVIFYEQSCYLASHLKRVDRTSMRAGIEVRLPFMDYRLVEKLNKIHFNDKFKLGEKNKKWILKKIGLNYLPKEIIERTKKGFSAPVDIYRNNIENYILEKYKMKRNDILKLNNQELFILMNVLNKYKL